MKIQYALISCTASPRYTEYWPAVAAAWLKLGITPVCLFIPNNPRARLPEVPGGIVHTIPPLNNVHIAIQGLMLRFWGSYLYPNAIVLTADIDAIPLSKHFFLDQLAAYTDDAYIHLRHAPGPYRFYGISSIPEQITSIDRLRYAASWFNIAKSEVLQRVLELSPSWETTCEKTTPYFLHKTARIKVSEDSKQGRASCYGYEISYAEANSAKPFYGDEIYPSIRLHHSNYRPLFYISYQSHYLYEGYVVGRDLFENTFKASGHYTLAHFSPIRYSEFKESIEAVVTKDTLPEFQRIWWISCLRRLINLGRYSDKKNKKIGPWLPLTLLTMLWLTLRLGYILIRSPTIKGHTQALLAILGETRNPWLDNNPYILRLYRRYLDIKSSLFSR